MTHATRMQGSSIYINGQSKLETCTQLQKTPLRIPRLLKKGIIGGEEKM